MLDTGKGGSRQGAVVSAHFSFLQLGGGLTGSVDYRNTGDGKQAMAFSPELRMRAGLTGRPNVFSGPFTFPKRTRTVAIQQRGNYIGLLPIKISGTTGHATQKTVWVLAITGYWRLVVGAVLAAGVAALFYVRKRTSKKWVHRSAKK
jgi:hypothetical protein